MTPDDLDILLLTWYDELHLLYTNCIPNLYCTLYVISFLPRCMECRRGLAMRFLSVCQSVRLSVKRVHCDKKEERYV